jgi:hypothetical protein
MVFYHKIIIDGVYIPLPNIPGAKHEYIGDKTYRITM